MYPWQLQIPLNAIIFDCDGTLTTLEGIDELAKDNHVESPVKALTQEAMGQVGMHPELYQKRLALVNPREEQVLALGQTYFNAQVPDAYDVIQLLKRLQKMIYIVSAGLYPAVKIFGELMQIPSSHIFAVNIQFDEQGHFIGYEQTSPLIHREGKQIIISQLKSRHPNLMHIGDGLNDFIVADRVTRFVGYGGVFYRENLATLCPYYIKIPSLASLLPLSLTEKEVHLLTSSEKILYQKGLEAIQEKNVLVQESSLKNA